ncbi:UNVERIFIED_CONTAM: GDSL esterase/lipase [Sesamum radiatum]|uniref:GDSL esterase/lipase n=1 Tax=Sesamum radiatum TaxID=300843 RepID=A0AAW2P691_SESRA
MEGIIENARVLFVAIVLVSLALYVKARRIPAAPPCDFPAIYNFGDSNSDTGGISAIPPPYGVSYFHRPAGRNSDGRLIIDFIAEHLGLPYLSSYLDSIENSQAKEFSRALYTFDIGQNDIAAGFRKLTMPQLRAAIPDIVDQFAAAVTRLYQHGARAFWIHNTGPIGCLPAAMFYVSKPNKPGFFDKHGCIRSHNAIALEFNRQLKARVNTLRAELPHAALTYVDIYSAKYHLISNTKIYGFRDPFKICCGHHKNNVHVWCGQRIVINGSEILGAACGSPAACISWDGVHYSQAANQWIANRIANGSFSDPPMRIANACLKH